MRLLFDEWVSSFLHSHKGSDFIFNVLFLPLSIIVTGDFHYIRSLKLIFFIF